MTSGQQVRLIQYGGNEIVRTVVSVENGVVFVCREGEYLAALAENRDPVCIGFPMKDIIPGDSERSKTKQA